MLVHLILGPAAVGKTDHAVSLVRSLGSVVVALDRLQVFPELGTGTGRPRPEQVAGVAYRYLAERRVSEGELPVTEAVASVRAALHDGADAGFAVVEGASISVLNAVTGSDLLREYEVIIELLHPGPRDEYLPALQRRAERMLAPEQGMPSIAEELAASPCRWVDALDGYSVLRRWAERHGRHPRELPSLLEDGVTRRILSRRIAWQHYRRAVVTLARLSELVRGLQVRGLVTTNATALGGGVT